MCDNDDLFPRKERESLSIVEDDLYTTVSFPLRQPKIEEVDVSR